MESRKVANSKYLHRSFEMRIPLAVTILLCAVNAACADWNGDGSYESPYEYTSPVEDNKYFIDRRGQTMHDDPPAVVANEELSGSHYQQIHEREDFKRELASEPFLRKKYVGSSQDRTYVLVKTVNSAGNWKKTYESFEDELGIVIEFLDPMNPNQVVGAPKYVTVKSTMKQDIDGDSGELKVKALVQKANPNPNTDPPADAWVFTFTFDFPNDNWTVTIGRKVNDVIDIFDSDEGTWSPYGVGTHIDLAGPTEPLSNTPADWYLEGENADDAWTLVNNIHHHPGPIGFSFWPYPEAFLTHYQP